MSEPRIRPISKDAATGTQRLLIETAEANGAPDPLAPRSTFVARRVGTGYVTGMNCSTAEFFLCR